MIVSAKRYFLFRDPEVREKRSVLETKRAYFGEKQEAGWIGRCQATVPPGIHIKEFCLCSTNRP